MRHTILILIFVLVLTSCFTHRPGYSCNDKRYFECTPTIVKKEGEYFLQWNYGSLGFYFIPGYHVRKGAVYFTLTGTSSSGNLSGKRGQLLIEGQREQEALIKGGAFWWNSDGTRTKLKTKL